MQVPASRGRYSVIDKGLSDIRNKNGLITMKCNIASVSADYKYFFLLGAWTIVKDFLITNNM